MQVGGAPLVGVGTFETGCISCICFAVDVLIDTLSWRSLSGIWGEVLSFQLEDIIPISKKNGGQGERAAFNLKEQNLDHDDRHDRSGASFLLSGRNYHRPYDE